MAKANTNWIPNLTGQITEPVNYAIQTLFTRIYGNQAQIAALQAAPPAPLNAQQLAQVRKELQVGGQVPLNITQLLGSTGGNTTTINNNFAPGWSILSISSNHVSPDIANGINFKLTLNQATQVIVNNPIWTGKSSVPTGTEITLWVIIDATPDRPLPGWGTAFGNSVVQQQTDGTANTYSIYYMVLWDDGVWRLKDFNTGLPL